MTDKEIVERAKEAEKRTGFGELVHSPISKGVNSAYGIGFIEGMVEYRNSLQKEPVSGEQVKESAKIQHVNDTCKNSKDSLTQEPISEELEEEIKRFIDIGGDEEKSLYKYTFVCNVARHFANWQKELMMSKAIEGEVIANGMGNSILHLWDKGRHLIDKKVKVIVINEE